MGEDLVAALRRAAEALAAARQAACALVTEARERTTQAEFGPHGHADLIQAAAAEQADAERLLACIDGAVDDVEQAQGLTARL